MTPALPRPLSRRSVLLPLALLLGWGADGAVAQATPYLPPGDAAYRDLDRLAAWGLVDTLIVGQRPWSERRARAVAAQARRNLGRLDGAPGLAGSARELLERVEARLGGAPAADGAGGGADLAGGVRLDATGTDSPWRPVPPNGLVESSALLNPLLAYDHGREIADGTTVGLEGALRGRPHRRLALGATVRGAYARPRGGGGSELDGDLRTAYARTVAGNVALTVGRAPVVWGQGVHGGLLLSSNPRPLLQVAVANEDPVVLPWILGLLGPGRHQAFYADLGTRGRTFPHAFLVNLRSSFQPTPRLEIGFGLLNQQGGSGAPGASVAERIADILVVPDLFITDRDFVFSQKMIQLDGRLRVPGARGLEVWVETVLDDFDLRRLGSSLWEDAGWLVGARVSRLDRRGRLALTVEGQHTGLRFYGHLTFRGGVTVDRRFLGSELGTDGNGLHARLEWDSPGLRHVALDGWWERRRNDRYVLVADEPPHGFVRTASRPEEERLRAVLAWTRPAGPSGGWWVGARLGVESVRGFGFTAGDDRTFGLVRVVLGWEPGRRPSAP